MVGLGKTFSGGLPQDLDRETLLYNYLMAVGYYRFPESQTNKQTKKYKVNA